MAVIVEGRLEEDIAEASDRVEVVVEPRVTIRDIVAEEDAKLVERNAQVEMTRQLLVVAILAALAGTAILTYALFTRTQQQVSALARTQNALMMQNEELEAHVRERTAEAEEAREHAERERARVEALLQDTNHRIGNSLATVSSLLGLQLTRSQSDEVRRALEAAQSRVHAIASVHRQKRIVPMLFEDEPHKFIRVHVVFDNEDASFAHFPNILRLINAGNVLNVVASRTIPKRPPRHMGIITECACFS